MVKVFKNPKGKQQLLESYDKLLQVWNVNKEEVSVKTRYGTTHVILTGDKNNPPLLLFHGVGDNSALMWIFNIQEFTRHFQVIAVDTIGGPGKSEPDKNYGKGFDQSLWIDDIMDFLKIVSTNIAGVSNGAYLAQLYAVKRPEKVMKVVCMAGSVSVKSKSSHLLRMLKVFLPEALFPTEGNTKKLIKKLCGPNYRVFEDNEELMKHWVYLLKYFDTMAMKFHKVIPLSDKELDILRVKGLFLLGDCDILSYHPEAVNALKINNMNYKIIKDAGHGINHEQAEIVNKMVVDFLLTSVP